MIRYTCNVPFRIACLEVDNRLCVLNCQSPSALIRLTVADVVWRVQGDRAMDKKGSFFFLRLLMEQRYPLVITTRAILTIFGPRKLIIAAHFFPRGRMLVECWMLTFSKLHVLPPPPRTDGPSPPAAVHMQSFLRDEAAIHSLLIILGGSSWFVWKQWVVHHGCPAQSCSCCWNESCRIARPHYNTRQVRWVIFRHEWTLDCPGLPRSYGSHAPTREHVPSFWVARRRDTTLCMDPLIPYNAMEMLLYQIAVEARTT
jgi:hypothetical protein